MATPSHPAASSFSRSISNGSSSAEEVKPDINSCFAGRWECRLIAAFTVCLVVVVVAMALVCWSHWIKDFGVSINLLADVAAGGLICGFLLFNILVWYYEWKKEEARLPETQQAASDLV